MNYLRGFLLKNVGLKTVSLLLAFLLWLNISSYQTIQRTISIPVEFVNMPEFLEIANEYHKEVDVVIRTDRSTTRFDERQLSVTIDMREITSGQEIVIPLSSADIRNRPPGVEILNIDPARLRLHVERTKSRIVGVVPKIVGEPLAGHEVREVRVTPESVIVTGPESRVDRVSTAETEPIDVSERSTSFIREAYLDLDDPRLRIEKTASVRAEVIIEEKRKPVVLQGVGVEIEPAGTGARAQNRTVEVTGSVPLSFSGQVRAGQVRAVLRLPPGEWPDDALDIIPLILVPEEFQQYFRVESIRPETVRVRRGPDL